MKFSTNQGVVVLLLLFKRRHAMRDVTMKLLQLISYRKDSIRGLVLHLLSRAAETHSSPTSRSFVRQHRTVEITESHEAFGVGGSGFAVVSSASTQQVTLQATNIQLLSRLGIHHHPISNWSCRLQPAADGSDDRDGLFSKHRRTPVSCCCARMRLGRKQPAEALPSAL